MVSETTFNGAKIETNDQMNREWQAVHVRYVIDNMELKSSDEISKALPFTRQEVIKKINEIRVFRKKLVSLVQNTSNYSIEGNLKNG